MGRYNGKLLELPKKGKALIITDIHGNLDDYNRYMSIWEKFGGHHNHLIITGDFIHAAANLKDSSIEILDSIKDNFENSNNFHVLLGNHEWAHITGIPVYKGDSDQRKDFEKQLRKKYWTKWEDKLEEYKNFFMGLPIAVKTKNKIFISHSGPSNDINNIEEVRNITNSGYSGNTRLYDLLWNRPEKFTERELNSFLKSVKCKLSIVGHTPVNGFKTVYNKQLIVSSSFSLGNKAYIELDLEKKINDINDFIKMVRYIE